MPHDRVRRTARRLSGGAALVEYILLIGLFVLFIIAALLIWRDALTGYIGRVADWIVGAPSTVAFTPPPVVTAPPPTPTPSPSPTPSQDWGSWLEGKWCSSDGVNDVFYKRVSSNVINVTRLYPDGRRTSQQVTITGTGPDSYRETVAESPGWFGNHQRIDDNTFRIANTASGGSGVIFRRC